MRLRGMRWEVGGRTLTATCRHFCALRLCKAFSNTKERLSTAFHQRSIHYLAYPLHSLSMRELAVRPEVVPAVIQGPPRATRDLGSKARIDKKGDEA
jgi:hypothetical protein